MVAEGDPEESKHGEDLYRNLVEKTEATQMKLLIPKVAGLLAKHTDKLEDQGVGSSKESVMLCVLFLL